MNQHCNSTEFRTDFSQRQANAQRRREDFANEVGLLRYIRRHRPIPQRCADLTRPVRLGDWFGDLPTYEGESFRPHVDLRARRESNAVQRFVGRPSNLRIPHLGGIRASKRVQSQR